MPALPDSNPEKVTLFVRLLNEGTDVSRPAEALDLGDGRFRLLPTANYDSEDEIWEFPPGSTVRAEVRTRQSGTYRLAVKD